MAVLVMVLAFFGGSPQRSGIIGLRPICRNGTKCARLPRAAEGRLSVVDPPDNQLAGLTRTMSRSTEEVLEREGESGMAVTLRAEDEQLVRESLPSGVYQS